MSIDPGHLIALAILAAACGPFLISALILIGSVCLSLLKSSR
jgi:hypothetical protein